MDELLAAAAKATGMSETMVKRSAAARAKAQGSTVEAVLAEWAGVEVPAGATSAPTTPAAPAAASSAVAAPAATPVVDVIVAGEEPAAPTAAAAAPVVVAPEVVPVGAIPRWLAALFVAVPLFALAYLAFLPNGPSCGDAGRLAVDPVSGEMVNCDGSAIGGEVEVDFYALGETIYTTKGACYACHGPGGAGVGTFPAFTGGGLLSTFPEGSCSVQQEWIGLGTAGWPEATYGATNKPVGGSGAAMPGFGVSLTAEEIHAVALFERVAFGGQDLEAAKADCAGTAAEPAETTTAAAGG